MTYDDLRACVTLANNTDGADRWTAEEWLKLYAAYQASEWDRTPCQWSEEQIEQALEHGIAPEWDQS